MPTQQSIVCLPFEAGQHEGFGVLHFSLDLPHQCKIIQEEIDKEWSVRVHVIYIPGSHLFEDESLSVLASSCMENAGTLEQGVVELADWLWDDIHDVQRLFIGQVCTAVAEGASVFGIERVRTVGNGPAYRRFDREVDRVYEEGNRWFPR